MGMLVVPQDLPKEGAASRQHNLVSLELETLTSQGDVAKMLVMSQTLKSFADVLLVLVPVQMVFHDL